jgi:hypothetical protein
MIGLREHTVNSVTWTRLLPPKDCDIVSILNDTDVLLYLSDTDPGVTLLKVAPNDERILAPPRNKHWTVGDTLAFAKLESGTGSIFTVTP